MLADRIRMGSGGKGKIKFVAGCSSGYVAVSNNGINWKLVNNAGFTSTINEVKYIREFEMYIAVANNQIAISYDGYEWIQAVCPDIAYDSVAYGKGYFIAVGGNTGYMAYSTDAINWHSIYFSYFGPYPQRSIAYNNYDGKFWIASTNGNTMYATDPLDTWYVRTGFNENYSVNKVVSDGYHVVACGRGEIGHYAGSGNYFPITPLPSGYTNYTLTDVATDGNKWIFIGSYSSNRATFTTTDFVNISARTQSTIDTTMYCITYGNGLWIIGSSNGYIYTSSDGTTWTKLATGLTQAFRSIAYGGE